MKVSKTLIFKVRH